uniref:Uncharacterized protein n=1 Tax=Panagrolaimus sp. PS1159 TaxID=55785 RepID=A0AC35FR75_9BILA
MFTFIIFLILFNVINGKPYDEIRDELFILNAKIKSNSEWESNRYRGREYINIVGKPQQNGFRALDNTLKYADTAGPYILPQRTGTGALARYNAMKEKIGPYILPQRTGTGALAKYNAMKEKIASTPN